MRPIWNCRPILENAQPNTLALYKSPLKCLSHKMRLSLWVWERVHCVRASLNQNGPSNVAPLPPPLPSPSIYLWRSYMPVRVWMQVCGWQLHSVTELTCTGWAEAMNSFTEMSWWHLWSHHWAKCQTYCTDETTFYCGSDNTIKQQWGNPW